MTTSEGDGGAAETVSVFCALPGGLEIQDGATDAKPVMLNGNAETDVPADLWHDWYVRHRDYAPVKSGKIYAVDRDETPAAEAEQ
jgi:hypothetical protein